MEKITTVLEIVMPIFAAIFLGILAKKRNIMYNEANVGLQQFVT